MIRKRSSSLSKRSKPKQESDKAGRRKFLPSPNPVTNLLIADIVVRGASTLFRQNVEKRVARASMDDDEAADKLADGKTLIRTLGLYGASRLATRSPTGLGIVAGGLALKTLYDRGKARQKRLSARKQAKAKSQGKAEEASLD